MFKANRILLSWSLPSVTHSSLASSSSQIKNYIQLGLYREALKLYSLSNSLHHVETDRFIVPSILKVCSSLSDQDFGRKVHGRILKVGLDSDSFISCALISFYVNFEGLFDARQVFDENPERDAASWNVMMDGYIRNGFQYEGIHLFKEMQFSGVRLDRYSLSIILGCRNEYLNLQSGKQIHAFVAQNAWGSDQFLVTALIDMYAKCGEITDAWQVFNKAAERRTEVWNAMISAFVINGMWEDGLEMCRPMHIDGVDFGSSTFSIVLQACSQGEAVLSGMEIHSRAIRMGYECHPHVSTSILTMYMKCLQVDDARQLFDLICPKETASWNAIISGYSYNDYNKEALMMFANMRSSGIEPDFSTISTVLAACACSVEFLDFGKAVHGDAVKRAAYANIIVQSALITMYARCGLIDAAQYIFNKIEDRDLVSCCSMIVGFSQNRRFKEAFGVFKLMVADCLKPDSMVMVSLLTACAGMEDIQSGLQIHGFVTKKGFASDVYVGTALIDMYAKCRSPELAGLVFSSMPKRNLVSWNAIVSAYARNNQPGESINLFAEITKHGLKPNSISVTSVMAATASLAAILQGKSIHGYIIRHEILADSCVNHSLIDTYMKCGNINLAHLVFDKSPVRDTVAWNTMITGYGTHGHCLKAFELFDEMIRDGTLPDDTTFLSLISACSHGGLVQKGSNIFTRMIGEFKIVPRMEHYACMVDLLSRAGRLNEARTFIERMPIQADARVWMCLLSACRVYNRVQLGEHAMQQLMDLEPAMDGHLVQLLNLYKEAGLLKEAAKVTMTMKEKGLRKMPGCSWIEVKDKINVFLSMDSTHSQIIEVYWTLEGLTRNIEEQGYVLRSGYHSDASLLLSRGDEDDSDSLPANAPRKGPVSSSDIT